MSGVRVVKTDRPTAVIPEVASFGRHQRELRGSPGSAVTATVTTAVTNVGQDVIIEAGDGGSAAGAAVGGRGGRVIIRGGLTGTGQTAAQSHPGYIYLRGVFAGTSTATNADAAFTNTNAPTRQGAIGLGATSTTGFVPMYLSVLTAPF